MSDTQNFIEINGKRYDAVTGAMVGESTKPTARPIQLHKPVVDGFVKRPKTTQPNNNRSVHMHNQHPQKSKTLMRTAVKKPIANNVSSASNASPKKTLFGKATVMPRTSTIPEHRQKLADNTQKSNLVHKFGSSEVHPIKPTVVPLQVHTAPAQTQPRLTKTAELLEKALQAAEGHNEPYFQSKKKLHHKIAKKIGVSGRAVAITTSILAAIAFGGFYAYQNVPRIAMKVAASRAGFGASMPNYSPSGFSFSGPVQYSEGQVTVGFKSNTDDRNYKITQQTSDWSSDSLLNNFLVTSGKTYQTYQDRGRTIYIYDNNNATWVDGGVWYQIEGKSDLTSDQLVRIANSL